MKKKLVLAGMVICILYFIILFVLQGCSTNNSNENGISPYCFADHQCVWYDEDGIKHEEWLCQEEMTTNMTCR